MLAASVGKKQIGRVLLILVLGIVLVFVAIHVIGRIKGKSGAETKPIAGATQEERENYLLSVGIQVDPTSSIAEVAVPEEFDERFAAYNEILKSTGFNLEDFRGKTVKKCTYVVTNRPDLGNKVSAVLIIYDGNIIAGHIVDNTTNSLFPLFVAAPQQQTQETILPNPTPPAGEPEAPAPEETVDTAAPTEVEGPTD